MKYNKPTAEVVTFDFQEFLMISVPGLGNCDEVYGPMTQQEVYDRVGSGHGACSGFSYDPNRDYYECTGYARKGYHCETNHCAAVDEFYCHVVSK